jgi:hypothetical protein
MPATLIREESPFFMKCPQSGISGSKMGTLRPSKLELGKRQENGGEDNEGKLMLIPIFLSS